MARKSTRTPQASLVLVLFLLALYQITNGTPLLQQISSSSSSINEECPPFPPFSNLNQTTVLRHTPTITDHPQFVFLMGTEGSGHHLWSSLIEQSPNLATLKQLNLLEAAESITHQLFAKRQLEESLFAGSACHTDWNGTKLLEQTAHKLRFVANKLQRNSNNFTTGLITVPLNGIPSTKPTSGMMSYPNYKSNEKCAGFRHPDMRLLQQACSKASVSCHFILQYRDPMAILRSTTQKRKLHAVGYAIALYTAMLNTLTMQLLQLQRPLSSSSSSATTVVEFCWDYSNPRPSARLGSLLGYKTEEEFRIVFEKNYVPSSTTNNNVVPKQYEMLLESLMSAHHQLQKTCHDMQPL